jgi:hypothetical protein
MYHSHTQWCSKLVSSGFTVLVQKKERSLSSYLKFDCQQWGAITSFIKLEEFFKKLCKCLFATGSLVSSVCKIYYWCFTKKGTKMSFMHNGRSKDSPAGSRKTSRDNTTPSNSRKGSQDTTATSSGSRKGSRDLTDPAYKRKGSKDLLTASEGSRKGSRDLTDPAAYKRKGSKDLLTAPEGSRKGSQDLTATSSSRKGSRNVAACDPPLVFKHCRISISVKTTDSVKVTILQY